MYEKDVRLMAGAELLRDVVGRDFVFYDGVIRSALARRPIQEADREDCLQELWLDLLATRLKRFRGGDLKAWLTAVARNKAADVLRRTHRRPICRLPDDVSCVAPSEHPHRADEARALVWSTLAVVEPVVHPLSLLVFVLRWMEGWSFEEIGEVLGLTPSQARLRHHRVKLRFRELVIERSRGDAFP